MATDIVMPRQGQSVEACTIVRWLKQPGDTVATGELLCEIETDKASFEVESTAAGTVLAHFAGEGEEVAVLTPIAAVGEPGEQQTALRWSGWRRTSGRTGAGSRIRRTGHCGPGVCRAAGHRGGGRVCCCCRCRTRTGGFGGRAAGVRQGGRPHRRGARRRAAELGVDYSALAGSGPNGRIIERDVVAAAQARPALTGAARAAAAAGAPVPAAGSGIGGRVTLADLAAAAPGAAPEAVETVPITGVRKLISERMQQSLSDTAQLTMHATADGEALLAYRARLKASPEHLGLAGVTINDLVLYAVARTLPRYPELNAVVAGDQIERQRMVQLAFAVDTDRGLVVPVIGGADRLSIAALAARAHELAAATQAGSISPDLLHGGTFTVTNLGALGVESFTPILNLPQVAILGVGALTLKPVLADPAAAGAPDPAQVTWRRHLGLSLTIDHRVVDGAPAARFLQALGAAVADIDLLAAL